MKGIIFFLYGIFWGCVACCFGALGPHASDSLLPVRDTLGFDTLAGDLPGLVEAHAKPYLVIGDIYVPQGKTVIIEAGAVFLFKNFTGLHSSGILLARGSKDKPIIFTSENDRDYNRRSAVDPAPFDWNGLYIHEDGIGTHLAYCAIMYSVEGITSLTKFIRLNTCIFLHNGRANLTMEGKQLPVSDQPFDYALTGIDPSLMRVPAGILKDPQGISRTILRYSGVATAVTGLVMAMIWGNKYSLSSHEFSNRSARNEDNLAHYSEASWNSARMNKNRDAAVLLTGCSVAVLGGIGIGWSFTF
jgi:hypothetical protein